MGSFTDKYSGTDNGNRPSARRQGHAEVQGAAVERSQDRYGEDRAQDPLPSPAEKTGQRGNYHRVGNKIVSYGKRKESEAPPTDIF